ncbi:MAG: tRNA lysidine(34) synthetase TilS [Candidatus Methylacidiphilales bacterium]|nr:tRNA lysidine(34) synthetase TilS [Candidatus Methylacidiphilales bacterium]
MCTDSGDTRGGEKPVKRRAASTSDPLVEVLRKALALGRLPERFMCGVSGGIDSCALLNALAAAGTRPIVVHYDHGWGAAAAEDPEFIRTLAAQYGTEGGLEFYFDRADPPPEHHREDEARRARYGFFARLGARLGCPDIVLAHNADDQVETLLMQLLRGGGSGAAGIRERSDLVLPEGQLRVHRPWLGVWRREIEAYAATHGVVWKEDATNADPGHLRNKLRHQLIPQLAELAGPAVKEKLHGFAETRRAETDWLDALCAPWAAKQTLSVKELRALPDYALHRVLWTWLRGRKIPNLKRRDVENVASMLASDGPAKVNLPGAAYGRRQAGVVFIERSDGTVRPELGP